MEHWRYQFWNGYNFAASLAHLLVLMLVLHLLVLHLFIPVVDSRSSRIVEHLLFPSHFLETMTLPLIPIYR